MKYRKKPVVVEAQKLTKRNFAALAEWCGGVIIKDGRAYSLLLIKTLEGEMKANLGDYIIKGVQGEFYPCKPDIFEATYEPAS